MIWTRKYDTGRRHFRENRGRKTMSRLFEIDWCQSSVGEVFRFRRLPVDDVFVKIIYAS